MSSMIKMKAVLVPLLLFLAASAVHAAPQITWLFPNGSQRGTSSIVYVHGSGLKDLAKLFSTGTGISAEVQPFAPPPKSSDKQDGPTADTVRAVRLTISQDASLGVREMRVCDPSAISNPMGFQVGQWPEVKETEPNDTPETANAVTLPVTINAKIQQGADRDCYRFTARAGQQISCDLYAERLFSWIGDSWLKGYLEVLDPHGNSLAESKGRFHWDPVINFTAPEDGDYTVRFRDLNWRGSPLAAYRLTIGAVPYADSIFPPGGRRGEAVKVALTGVNLGSNSSLLVPAVEAASGEFRLHTPQGESNPLPFQLGKWPEFMEAEPNNNDAQANRLEIPVTINGRMDQPGDRDCFRFHSAAGQRLILEINAYRMGSTMDSYLTLRDSQGKLLVENDDARDRDSLLDYTIPAAGDYIVEVRDTDLQSGPECIYRLSIGPPQPDFHLTATPDRIVIPAGGASRVDVKLDRQWGFDGEVKLQVEGLPPGMTASQAAIPHGSDHAILTLQAPPAASAPLPAPAAVRISGAGKIGSEDVTRAAASEETYNVQGTAYQRKVIGPVVMVGPAAPFSLRTASSDITLKAGSEAHLDVQIARAGSAKGPVKVSVDELPAGIHADPLNIADGASSGVLILKADEDAAEANRAVLLTGSLTAPDGGTSTAAAPALQLHLAEIPAFSLALEKPEITIAKGKTATLKVILTRRGGFNDPVDLSISGLPPGVTADPARIEQGKNEVQVTLKAGPTAQPPASAPEIHIQGAATVSGEKKTRSSQSLKLTIN